MTLNYQDLPRNDTPMLTTYLGGHRYALGQFGVFLTLQGLLRDTYAKWPEFYAGYEIGVPSDEDEAVKSRTVLFRNLHQIDMSRRELAGKRNTTSGAGAPKGIDTGVDAWGFSVNDPRYSYRQHPDFHAALDGEEPVVLADAGTVRSIRWNMLMLINGERVHDTDALPVEAPQLGISGGTYGEFLYEFMTQHPTLQLSVKETTKEEVEELERSGQHVESGILPGLL